VRFQSGEIIPAKVITVNSSTDVAKIRLMWMPKKYVIAKIGDSKTVNIGDKIFIIGAPFGLERSLSVGYVSGRLSEKGDGQFTFSKSEFFQTDASINHGNSGGPMFNLKGEVIGIVSSILSQSGGFDGIGFVVTSEIANLHLSGDQPFWYGAEFKVIGGELRTIFNLNQSMGLLVQKVAAGSPAALSGLRAGVYKTNIEGMEILTGGDIIIKIADFEVSPDMDMNAVGDYLISLKSNQTFKVTVLREGSPVELIGVVPGK
jgi:S1-C subfamily serine protease